MRFFANGPNIPEELLENRDNGNVVFFCGAGISRPAGLPGFADLAEQVVEELGAPPNAKVRMMLGRARQEPEGSLPLDQIFSILQQEYRSTNIDDIVSRLLRTPASANVDQHLVILRLSRNAAHQTQIVTTNFDLLFERAHRGIQKHVAPALPDLSSGQPLTGLVYLHGRLNPRVPRGVEPHRLILSSSDFGRAYLADGWATRFVRDLLKNYVIVLLGYSATDPPVRYLLEGLHARADVNSAKIYAFDQGTETEVFDRWRDRGVVPLAYPKCDAVHSALWDSLRAWANRADDPDEWRRSTLALASNDPKSLAAYQRGQVLSLVRTTEGAKLFAEALDVPPPEWICVFDKHVRYGEPRDTKNPETDPLAVYGIDDDPPRIKQEGKNNDPRGLDALSMSPFDERRGEYSRLAGVSRRFADPVSPRLFYISRWIGKLLKQPAILWWVAGYNSLHPSLIDQIDFHLNHGDNSLDERARRIWELLLQKFSDGPEKQNFQYHFISKIKKRGWSSQSHNEFEAAIRPFLKARRPFDTGSLPPTANWEELQANQTVHFEVEFPARGSNDLEIPPEHLYRCFRSVRRGLERGSELLRAIETRYWHTASFQTDQRPGERHLRDSDLYLHWAKNLFDQLVAQNSTLARSEIQRWPDNDEYFFDKLKIFFCMNKLFLSGRAVADVLLGLGERGFWDGYHRRELLHTLKARWNDIPIERREKIEQRFTVGRAAYENEESDEARKRRAGDAVSILGWLQKNGCVLSDNIAQSLPALRAVDPKWNTAWELNADESLDGRVSFVAVKEDPTKIIDLPISQIIEAAGQHSIRTFMEFTEHRPFSGLVKQRPRSALAALAYQARRNNFPIKYWETALEDWPLELPERLRSLFALRLARLPAHILTKLSYYAPRWIKKQLPELASKMPAEALAIWDAVLQGLASNGAESLQSGIGDMTVGGKSLNRSRRTYDHAINGPIGVMAETLFEILSDRELPANSGIPDDIRDRITRLFGTPGEGADHAVCETTIRLNWLFYLDPKWVEEQLLPIFSIDNKYAEPAWNGYLHNENLGVPELFALLKPHFLRVFESYSTWGWDDQPIARLNEFLVVACYWNQKAGRYISYAEARLALQRATDEGRSHAIWLLGSIVKDQNAWKAFGKPFIAKAWPREARYQTESSSRQFAAIAEDAGDNFPEVVRTIIPLLVPSSQLDLFVYKAKERDGDDEEEAANLPREFPASMLALLDKLVSDDPSLAPYDLGSLVTTIVATDASLRQDFRWRRLNRIVHAR